MFSKISLDTIRMDVSPVKALSHLIWHIYCTIAERIKMHEAEYGRNGSDSIPKFWRWFLAKVNELAFKNMSRLLSASTTCLFHCSGFQ